jgi:hypothetical protein
MEILGFKIGSYWICGFVVLLGLLVLRLVPRLRRSTCWRCKKTYRQKSMVFMETVNDWSCKSCSDFVQKYYDVP